jgi:hypothetical protein
MEVRPIENRKRKRGSVIFSPYYKIQKWDAANLVWGDLQKRYDSKDEAENNFPPNEKCRIMEVTMQGRSIL